MADTPSQNQQPRRGHGPMGGMHVATEKPKDLKGTLIKLLKEMAHYRFAFVFAFVCALASVTFNVFGPKVLGSATTKLFEGVVAKISGTGEIDFAAILAIILSALAIYGGSLIAASIQGWLMTGISQRLVYSLRARIARKISVVPLSYFDGNNSSKGDVLSRMTNDVDTLGQSLNQSVIQFVTSITQIVGVLIMMISISVPMTGIALVTLPVSVVIVGIIVKFSQRYFIQQQAVLGQVNGQIEEDFSGQQLIQTYNRAEDAIAQFEVKNNELFSSAWKSQFFSGLMQPLMVFVGDAGYVAVVIMGAVFAAQGTITAGDIQSFIQYVRNFTQPIQQLATVSNVIQQMTAAAERVFEFLAAPEEEETASAPASYAASAATPTAHRPAALGSVDFDHVSFGYVPNQTIIHDFDAHIAPGQTVAIVGPTGAGKTTLMKLLLRFYDVNAGSLKVNGTDVRDLTRAELRQNVAMVLQDSWMFEGTIRENIRFGTPNATDKEVEAAAKYAHCEHFIDTLPGGYDFVINEGASNISQGQRQLLTIARAVLANRPLLVLDEATSNVDTRTEWRIQRSMDKLMAGRTSFVIAHRLSTIKDADVILVLKDGDIIESGNHQELLKLNGFYAQLYNSQFEETENAA